MSMLKKHNPQKKNIDVKSALDASLDEQINDTFKTDTEDFKSKLNL